MANTIRVIFSILLLGVALSVLACGTKVESNQNSEPPAVAAAPTPSPQPTATPTPTIPNLQAELTDDRFRTTTSPIGSFDFKNYTYDLPRGWQNPDGTTEIKLVKGRLGALADETSSERHIGMSYVTAKYLDVTGDGDDEAVVVLKVETGGSAVPQLVYVFSWKNGAPELIWPFRTGDRADGGLKDIRSENGMVIVELYGQDRFILGQMETRKITGDVEQLCCPTHFTRSTYKWNGTAFLMAGKRLTFVVANPTAQPIENLGDKINAQQNLKKK